MECLWTDPRESHNHSWHTQSGFHEEISLVCCGLIQHPSLWGKGVTVLRQTRSILFQEICFFIWLMYTEWSLTFASAIFLKILYILKKCSLQEKALLQYVFRIMVPSPWGRNMKMQWWNEHFPPKHNYRAICKVLQRAISNRCSWKLARGRKETFFHVMWCLLSHW